MSDTDWVINREPWKGLTDYRIGIRGYASHRCVSGLTLTPKIVNALVTYSYWLFGHRAAGNVLFAEVIGSILNRQLREWDSVTARYEKDIMFAMQTIVLRTGSFFDKIQFDTYTLCEGSADSTNTLVLLNGETLLGQPIHYLWTGAGVITYAGPSLTSRSLEGTVSLPASQPVKLWHKNT